MKTPSLCARIDGLFTGSITECWAGKPPSAINKLPAHGLQNINLMGFEHDLQADLRFHGGIDKALHHYSADHYSHWQKEGQMVKGMQPAAFGENISTSGLDEHNLCIGDILYFGTSTVQISQGRQPCWKLNAHTENPKMVSEFTKSARTGWYYRVLEIGVAAVGDRIKLVERPNPEWTVAKVTHARLTRRITPDDAKTLSTMSELTKSWRDAFFKMALGDLNEDTTARIKYS